jgi:hypothetical protein
VVKFRIGDKILYKSTILERKGVVTGVDDENKILWFRAEPNNLIYERDSNKCTLLERPFQIGDVAALSVEPTGPTWIVSQVLETGKIFLKTAAGQEWKGGDGTGYMPSQFVHKDLNIPPVPAKPRLVINKKEVVS